LYKDLSERYNITNTVALKFFLKRVLSSTTKQISINKIYNELKSSGIKIGKNTLYEFLQYIQNIYLALVLHRYDNSLVSQELGEKKVYTIDIGLNNAVEFRFSENIGKSLENAVFLELKRRNLEIYYHRDAKHECDFLVATNNKITKAVQVSYDMSEDDTKQREIDGLVDACNKFNLKNGLIISYDTEDEIEVGGIVIQIIPFYKIFLDMDNFTKA